MNVFRDFLDALKKVITALSEKQFRNAPEARGLRDYYNELSAIYKNAVAGTFEKINEAANSEMSANSVDTSDTEMYNDKEQLSRKDKLIGKQFPSENESQSDANKYCTLWAKNPDVKSGDARLASYRDRWYLIEKFDSADFGYQIVERVKKAEYAKLKEKIGDVRNFGKEPFENVTSQINSSTGRQGENAGRNGDSFGDTSGHGGENSAVFSVGDRQYSGGESVRGELGYAGESSKRNKVGNRTSGSEEVKKQKSRKNSSAANPYSEYDKPITIDDVRLLREIIKAHNGERVSINNFTSEDIQKELGNKSPFFRAWFGDWRAQEKSNYSTVISTGTEYTGAGNTYNEDTGRKISWGSTVVRETNKHAVKNKSAVVALGDISKIIKSAILLDTVVSEPSSNSKMKNTAQWRRVVYKSI